MWFGLVLLNNMAVLEDKNCVEATVGPLPLYLEPVLVINDRETNPTRHEFYIKMFICAHAVLLDSSLRDRSFAMRANSHKKKSCAFSNPCYRIYPYSC